MQHLQRVEWCGAVSFEMNLWKWLQSAVALAFKDGGGGNTSGSAESPPQKQSPTGPNVILFLAEDLGYADLGTFGHPYAQTPNIDRFASQGTKLTNFHSTGKTCSVPNPFTEAPTRLHSTTSFARTHRRSADRNVVSRSR